MIMTTNDSFRDRLHANAVPEEPLSPSYAAAAEERMEPSSFLISKKFQIPVADAILHNFSRRTHGQDLGSDFEPLSRDVVCGRGKGSYNRPGNVAFRKVVRRFVEEYGNAKTKFEKTTVLNRIIDVVHHECDARFLKFNIKTRQWFEITDDQAREKVGHTMRETIAALELTLHEERKHHDLLSNQKAIFASMLRNSSGGSDFPARPQPSITSYGTFGGAGGGTSLFGVGGDNEPLPWPRSEV